MDVRLAPYRDVDRAALIASSGAVAANEVNVPANDPDGRPEGRWLAGYWHDHAPTEAAWITAVAAAPAAPDPAAAVADLDARVTKGQNVDNALATLRQWSLDAKAVAAQGANVTQAQHKALFDRMGTFLDRFADYVEAHR